MMASQGKDLGHDPTSRRMFTRASAKHICDSAIGLRSRIMVMDAIYIMAMVN